MWIIHVIIPAFFFRKKGYINFVSKSVRRLSVRLSVRPSVLVNVSPPKPLEVATSNISCDLDPWDKVKDQIMYFLVNVSPPLRLDVSTSNFVAGKVA